MILKSGEEGFPGTLEPGMTGEILGFDFPKEDESFFLRLLEVGFLPGQTISVLNVSPFGGDPMSVRVLNGVYAIRRAEADRIRVRRISV